MTESTSMQRPSLRKSLSLWQVVMMGLAYLDADGGV